MSYKTKLHCSFHFVNTQSTTPVVLNDTFNLISQTKTNSLSNTITYVIHVVIKEALT